MSACAGCGETIGEAHMFCRRCGRRVGVVCVCGAVGTADDTFCWRCGQAAGGRATASCSDHGHQDMESDAAPVEPEEDMLAEAKRDGRQFRLNRLKLDQQDIDEMFDGKEGNS